MQDITEDSIRIIHVLQWTSGVVHALSITTVLQSLRAFENLKRPLIDILPMLLEMPVHMRESFHEIDIRKCYMDIDRKFKGQSGIILSIGEWKKLAKAVDYVDARIEIARKRLQQNKSSNGKAAPTEQG